MYHSLSGWVEELPGESVRNKHIAKAATSAAAAARRHFFIMYSIRKEKTCLYFITPRRI